MQDFIWVATYADDTKLKEIDEDGKENSFYSIDKSRLFRFSLEGLGNVISFERNGLINVCGKYIRIYYEVDSERIKLNDDYALNITDIITYKEAETLFIGGQSQGNNITSFNIGYKTEITDEDLKFNFKPIVTVPLGEPVYLSIRLVANKKLDGNFIIEVNGQDVFKTSAPLEKNVGGELVWQI